MLARPLAWLRRDRARKIWGIALALLLEGVLLLALLSMGWLSPSPEKPRVAMTTITVSSDQQDSASEPARERERPRETRPSPQPQNTPTPPQRPVNTPTPPVTPAVIPPATPLIPLTREQMAAADISRQPAKPGPQVSGPMIGPANTGRGPDTPLMGTRGPGGEKLYAASWYNEPTDGEMRGYLSTADGPGWGLIACKTVPDFRVENCAIIDEYPRGSNIARAAVAASWQFRVRPPRLGGRVMVGEWVGIRIEYSR